MIKETASLGITDLRKDKPSAYFAGACPADVADTRADGKGCGSAACIRGGEPRTM